MLWVSVGGLKRGPNKRTLDSVEENIAEQRSEIQQPVEQKISRGGLVQNYEKEGQEHTVDIEGESAAKRDTDTEQRQRKQKIRKEQKVLKKAEGKLKKEEDRRKKQGKGDVRVKQMVLDLLDEGENRKGMKARIISDPTEDKQHTDHTVTSVLEVKDKEVKGDLGSEKENTRKNLLGQSLAMLPVERKSDEAPGLLLGEAQRVRWWRKQGFY